MMSREEMLKEVKWYCDELDMALPKGYPDEISDEELQDFIWCWSEFDPCPDLK